MKSELEIKDIFETKSFKDLLPKLLNTNLTFKGMTINSKLVLREIIKENILNSNSETLKNTTLLKIIDSFVDRLLLKKTYLFIYDHEINAYKEIKKLSAKNSIDIEKKFTEFKKSKDLIFRDFNKEKDLLLFENIDMNDISISFLFKLLEFGIIFTLKSKTIDDIKNDLILKKKDKIKKEIAKKEKEEREKNKNENNNQEININEIVNEFRNDFDLNEKDYPNEVIIEKLRFYNFDKNITFASLFN